MGREGLTKESLFEELPRPDAPLQWPRRVGLIHQGTWRWGLPDTSPLVLDAGRLGSLRPQQNNVSVLPRDRRGIGVGV